MSKGGQEAMADKEISVIYDGVPIRSRMAMGFLLGIGGLVFVPIGLINRAWWLLILAVPLLLAGLVLSQIRLRIVAERQTGAVRVVNLLAGLKVRERRYPPLDVLGLDLRRVAGDERERASDTYYLVLRLGLTTYTVGKYDSREHALEARQRLLGVLQTGPRVRAYTEE